ncbi:MAG: hydrolase [Epulopiscium sp.]|nr:hydrolase [Candidatus Epulonipiscium sp.]
MSYYFYFDKLLLPVAPPKMQLSIRNKNETVTLINEGEVNLLKTPGLTDISFEVLIPSVEYPFALYKSSFMRPSVYLDEFERLKVTKKAFQFIVTRTLPDGALLFDTNMKVSLEDYKIDEDAKNGFDLKVNINLKQYEDYGTKVIEIIPPKKPDEKPKAMSKKERPTDTKIIVIGSDVVVNGRLHRDSFGKGAGQMRTNYRGKVNFIKKGRSHPYHITTPSGGWQGWVTASSVKGV